MIVRNEETVIGRSITSVRCLIDTWVIVDTGSTDRTIEVVNEAMRGLSGILVSAPWEGFASSRNRALSIARSIAEYVIFLDADDYAFSCDPERFRSTLATRNIWSVWAYDGWIRHAKTFAISSAANARWVGDVHEYLVAEPTDVVSAEILPGVAIRYTHQGARSRDPATFSRDFSALRRTSTTNPEVNEPRRIFYLARTLHLHNEFIAAECHYSSLVKNEQAPPEMAWLCAFEACRIREYLGQQKKVSALQYAQLITQRSSRAEPSIELVRLLRESGRFDEALALAEYCATLTVPEDQLFVDISCYRWRAWDEIATVSLLIGNVPAAIENGIKALLLPGVPSGDRVRISENLRTARHMDVSHQALLVN